MNRPALIERIVDGLTDRSPEAAAQTGNLAKSAFLRWPVSPPRDVDVHRAARTALAAVDRIGRWSPAVALLKSYLETAARPLPTPVRRGGRDRQDDQGGTVH